MGREPSLLGRGLPRRPCCRSLGSVARRYWLLKSDPATFGFVHSEKSPKKTSRLSVQPVTVGEWSIVNRLGSRDE